MKTLLARFVYLDYYKSSSCISFVISVHSLGLWDWAMLLLFKLSCSWIIFVAPAGFSAVTPWHQLCPLADIYWQRPDSFCTNSQFSANQRAGPAVRSRNLIVGGGRNQFALQEGALTDFNLDAGVALSSAGASTSVSFDMRPSSTESLL